MRSLVEGQQGHVYSLWWFQRHLCQMVDSSGTHGSSFGKSLWAAGDLYNYTGPLPDKLEPHYRVRKLSRNLKLTWRCFKCNVGLLIHQEICTLPNKVMISHKPLGYQVFWIKNYCLIKCWLRGQASSLLNMMFMQTMSYECVMPWLSVLFLFTLGLQSDQTFSRYVQQKKMLYIDGHVIFSLSFKNWIGQDNAGQHISHTAGPWQLPLYHLMAQ
jgi:hypothetical protein